MFSEETKVKRGDQFSDLNKELWDFAHLQLGSEILIDKTPFSDLTEHDITHPDEKLLQIMMNPDYFGWTCSKIFNTAINENGLELLPMQCAILRELWYRPFPMLVGSRGLGKSFILGLYALLRALFIQGRKIVITGAGFRQSKIIFNYAELIWNNSPILRDICGASHDKSQGPHRDTDRWSMQIGESVIYALPIGTGEKIRGQRAHDIIADEFGSMRPKIFEEVIAGFGVVNLDPISQVKYHYRMQQLKELQEAAGDYSDQNPTSDILGNQIVISGTATFSFNHFCAYWHKYKDVITSQGDSKTLSSKGIDPGTDPSKYSIFRIPVELLPKGFMDEAQIQRSKTTLTVGIYQNEFGSVFSDDSNGFFRRSILEKATPSETNIIRLSSGTTIYPFNAMLTGDKDKKYIMGIDTASQRDNFAIVILETYEDHARIVHCWTTNSQDHMEKRKNGHVKEKDFYAYAVDKIRVLLRTFNVIHVAIDSQGGGMTIYQLLHNEKHIIEGDQLLWECDQQNILWDGKEKDTDGESGAHIVEMVNFSNAKYTSDANHGMKNDFEQRLLLFPYSDTIETILAMHEDQQYGRVTDTLDDVISEIDLLKDELQTIMVSPTPNSGREHWGVPRIKGDGEVGKLYDDRYAALLMANSAARRIRDSRKVSMEYEVGGFVGRGYRSRVEQNVPLYIGPSWFVEKVKNNDGYGGIIAKEDF